jgi:hypothetical protein
MAAVTATKVEILVGVEGQQHSTLATFDLPMTLENTERGAKVTVSIEADDFARALIAALREAADEIKSDITPKG